MNLISSGDFILSIIICASGRNPVNLRGLLNDVIHFDIYVLALNAEINKLKNIP